MAIFSGGRVENKGQNQCKGEKNETENLRGDSGPRPVDEKQRHGRRKTGGEPRHGTGQSPPRSLFLLGDFFCRFNTRGVDEFVSHDGSLGRRLTSVGRGRRTAYYVLPPAFQRRSRRQSKRLGSREGPG